MLTRILPALLAVFVLVCVVEAVYRVYRGPCDELVDNNPDPFWDRAIGDDDDDEDLELEGEKPCRS